MAKWLESELSNQEIWVRISAWLICQSGEIPASSTFGKCLRTIPQIDPSIVSETGKTLPYQSLDLNFVCV